MKTKILLKLYKIYFWKEKKTWIFNLKPQCVAILIQWEMILSIIKYYLPECQLFGHLSSIVF